MYLGTDGSANFPSQTKVQSYSDLFRNRILERISNTSFGYFFIVSPQHRPGHSGKQYNLIEDNFSEKFGAFGRKIRGEARRRIQAAPGDDVDFLAANSPRIWAEFESLRPVAGDIFQLPCSQNFPCFKYLTTYRYCIQEKEFLLFLLSYNALAPNEFSCVISELDIWQKNMAHGMGSPVRETSLTGNDVPAALKVREDAGGVATSVRSGSALSATELECLKWMAAGKTMQDISAITGLSYKSVRYNIEKAKNRYGFATVNQTLVQATLDYQLSPLGNG